MNNRINFEEELLLQIKAKKNLIWINTKQEEETILRIRNAVNTLSSNSSTYTWSATDGLCRTDTANNGITYESIEDTFSLLDLADNIKSVLESTYINSDIVYILKDFDVELTKNTLAARILKDIEEIPSAKYVTIIVLATSHNEIPKSIDNLFYMIDYEVPTVEEIETTVRVFISEFNVSLTDMQIKNISKHMYGYYRKEILMLLNLSMLRYGSITDDIIKEAKIKAIKESGVLEYREPTAKLENVGGNDNFKKWIEIVEASRTDEAKEYGIEPYKGYIAVGVPGASKTYTAEALAGRWDIPFVKLEMSNIVNRYHGGTESNMLKALNVVKSCAPCVLLIDEIEKGLGGYASSNKVDGGATARAFEALLTFLNDNRDVFVVMTCNDFSQLPPELSRAGRLDAIWYFSFPTYDERREIFRIHLNKYVKNRKEDYTSDDDMIRLIAKDTKFFTGAEIESIVKNAVNISFMNKLRGTGDSIISYGILKEAKNNVVPVALSSIEKIKQLEAWSIGRALRANKDIREDNEEDSIISNNSSNPNTIKFPAFNINKRK